jgi:hypothetical protein
MACYGDSFTVFFIFLLYKQDMLLLIKGPLHFDWPRAPKTTNSTLLIKTLKKKKLRGP